MMAISKQRFKLPKITVFDQKNHAKGPMLATEMVFRDHAKAHSAFRLTAGLTNATLTA